jgi:hypothetical protein
MSGLCLHIGLPKTGSSAIQGFLREHVDALSELGVHYALNGETEADSEGTPNGNGRAFLKYLDSRRRRPGFSLERFEDEFDRLYVSERHRLSLISSELLAGVEKTQLRRFRERILRDRPIMIVAVVRNLYDHAFSTWNQLVKRHAYAGGFERFVEQDYNNPQGRAVCNYARHFGWKRIRLVDYDAHPRDIVTPFLDVLGVQAAAGWKAPRVNRSLSLAELAVQRTLNRILRDPALGARAAERFVSSRPQAGSGRIWKPKAARLLAERYGDDIRQIGQKLGKDLGGLVEVRRREHAWISPLELAQAARDAWPVLRQGLEARRLAAREAAVKDRAPA